MDGIVFCFIFDVSFKTNTMKISRKTLSILSLLTIPGVLLMPYFKDSFLLIIPVLMCGIGGIGIGALTDKRHEKETKV